MHYVYILKSLKDGKLYVGMTQNVEERLAMHNAGKTFSTKHRRPFVLVYTEQHETMEAARTREVWLKSYKGSFEKRDIVTKHCRII